MSDETINARGDAQVEPEDHAAAEEQTAPVYWCVVCGRAIVGEVHEYGNVFVHDNIPHPDMMAFDEDASPQ
jgi:hypothetical protein